MDIGKIINDAILKMETETGVKLTREERVFFEAGFVSGVNFFGRLSESKNASK